MAKKFDPLASFAAAAAAAGINLEEIKEKIPDQEEEREEKQIRIAEADAVLKSLHWPHSLTYRKCGYCGDTFATNYCYVGYCSTGCRKAQFEKHYGIKWYPSGKRTFGEYEQPTVISASALEELYKWSKNLVANYEELKEIATESEPKVVRQVVGIGPDGHSTVRVLEPEVPKSDTLSLLVKAANEEWDDLIVSSGRQVLQRLQETEERDLPTSPPDPLARPEAFDLDLDLSF